MDPLSQLKNDLRLQIENKYPEKDYSECYVAFLDILGMKNLIDKDYKDLRNVFNSIECTTAMYDHFFIINGDKFISENQIRITIMSDSIVLSIKKSADNSFSKIVGISSALINTVLTSINYPIFIRGGIALGNLSHTNFSVFGPGLVNAYNIEKDTAKYMRCVISPDLYNQEDFIEYISKNKTSLDKDKSDDLYFINFIRNENISLIKEYAKSQIISPVLDIKIKEKYKWLLNLCEGFK